MYVSNLDKKVISPIWITEARKGQKLGGIDFIPGIPSINSSTPDNPFCEVMSMTKDSVCFGKTDPELRYVPLSQFKDILNYIDGFFSVITKNQREIVEMINCESTCRACMRCYKPNENLVFIYEYQSRKICYSQHELMYKHAAKAHFRENDKLLVHGNLEKIQIPNLSTTEYVRLFSHGELFSVNHCLNLLKIIKNNPSTIFVIWTKRKDILIETFKNQPKPKNLRVIYSLTRLNQIIVEGS